MHILVVEDDISSLHALASVLARRGHCVTRARSRAEAIYTASRESFDLMISDLCLPDGDGWLLMKQIRQLQPQLPALAVSSYSYPEDVAHSMTAGYSAHLVKPLSAAIVDRAMQLIFPTLSSRVAD
jgi:CheY-like chemotaxis protein